MPSSASWRISPTMVGSAAGSPGPLDKKIPSGSIPSTWSAGVDAGTTVTVANTPNWRNMASLMPKSYATTRYGPLPRVKVASVVTADTRSWWSVPGAPAAAARSSDSPAVPNEHGMAPWSRKWRVSRRVSMPAIPGTEKRTRNSSSDAVDRQLLGRSVRSRTMSPRQRGRAASSSVGFTP